MKLRAINLRLGAGRVPAKISDWFAPYQVGSKTALRGINNLTGVYLIRNKQTKRVKYVGSSRSNLAKTMIRHFQRWADRTQYRAVFPKSSVYEVRIIIVARDVVPVLEDAILQKTKPEFNFNGPAAPAPTFDITDIYGRESAAAVEYYEDDSPDLPF